MRRSTPGTTLSNDILDMLERAVAAYGLPLTRHPHHIAVDGERLLMKAGAEANPSPQGRIVATLQLQGFTLGDAYPTFLAALSRRFLESAPPGPHWIRVFVACYHGQLQSTEVLIDNEPWEEGQRLLRAQPWATTQAFQSIRHFMLALPVQPE